MEAIAKTTAHLSSADFNVSADNVTAKILKPRNMFETIEDIVGLDKDIANYYANIPNYFITHATIGKQANAVDIANNVLAIQVSHPELIIKDPDNDPFIQYLTNIVNANALYEAYEDLESTYKSYDDDDIKERHKQLKS